MCFVAHFLGSIFLSPPSFLPSCVQGVVWGGSAVGWVCADHTAGPAEEIRGTRLLLPPAEGE